jgi:glycosyltransferase involved in cell wall biosynthesis
MQEGLDGVELTVFVADNDPERHEAVSLCTEMARTYPYPLAAEVTHGKGISAARNTLLAEARRTGADLIAMIDDDEYASPRWLASLIATHAKFGADVIGGTLIYHFEAALDDGVAHSGAFVPMRHPDGPIEQIDASGNIMLDCSALARWGWPAFDDAFGLTGGGDAEYFARLKHRGCRFVWAADAVVYETVPAARTRPRAILRRAFRVGNCAYRISALHGSGRAKLMHLMKSAVVLAAALPLAPGLLVPRWRLKLLRRHAYALGKIGAALGHSRANYGAAISH